MKLHPSAAIDPRATLAPSVEVGPFCVVGPDVEIGEGTVLVARVTLTYRTRIGRRNVFHPTSHVGAPPQDSDHGASPQGWIEIGDGNVFREATTVHAPKGRVTRIGSRGQFEFSAHIGHDAFVGDDVTLGGFFAVGGHARIGDRASFGPHCAIHQYASAGRYCRSRSHTPITRDAPPYMRIGGNHYEVHGVNSAALRRDGFPEPTIAALEQLYERVWRSGLPLSEACLSFEDDPVPEVREVVGFLQRAACGRMGRALEAERVG